MSISSLNITKVYNANTAENANYYPVAIYADGTPMADAHCDGIVYKKLVDGTYVKLGYSGAIPLKQFGAAGDGTTDDSTAYNKCVNLCKQLGADIHIAAGDYNLAGVHLKLASDVTISADNKLSLINTIDNFIPGAGVDSVSANVNINPVISKGILFPKLYPTTTAISGNINIISRSKNIFALSQIVNDSIIVTSGALQGNLSFVATGFIFLKAGQKYTFSGWSNSIITGGTNNIMVVFNKDFTTNTVVYPNVTLASYSYTPTIDCYVRFSVSKKDLNTLQVEEGAAVTTYEAGQYSQLTINPGTYADGTAFTLNTNGSTVYDTIQYKGGGWQRIQNIAEGSTTPLTTPLTSLNGENGFSVTGYVCAYPNGRIIAVCNTTAIGTSIDYRITNIQNKLADDINTVKDNLIAAASTATTANNAAPCFNTKVLAAVNTLHPGGQSYTMGASGVMIGGKEIYFMRNSNSHATTANSITRHVAYIRNADGTFTTSILPLDYTLLDYREGNATVDPTGTYIFYKVTSYDLTTYKTWLYTFDSTLTQVGSQILIATGVYGFGNTLITPSGKLITCAYVPTTTLMNVNIYQSSGGGSAPGTFTSAANIFPSVTGLNINEVTIAYWGSKLVAVARADAGGGVSTCYTTYTTDLEGATGWQPPSVLSFVANCPAMEPYIPAKEPLVLSVGSWESGQSITDGRRPALLATIDFVNWTPLTYVIPYAPGSGGYQSFLKNRFGYGMMHHYEKAVDGSSASTAVYFTDIDINRHLPQLRYLQCQMS